MHDIKPTVVTSYGPCHKCGESIKEPEKPERYREHFYHQRCAPDKRQEKTKDNSYT
jgi:hypothetical protein